MGNYRTLQEERRRGKNVDIGSTSMSPNTLDSQLLTRITICDGNKLCFEENV
jgi:hypothetical protein